MGEEDPGASPGGEFPHLSLYTERVLRKCGDNFGDGGRAHTVHNLYYHVVWVPKYRRSILQGKVGERAEQVIRRVADEYGYTLDELKVSPDHIHVLLKLQPKQAIPDVVTTLKSITAALFQELPTKEAPLGRKALGRRILR